METNHDDLLLTVRYLRDAVHAMCLATDKLTPAQRALAEQAIVRADSQLDGSAVTRKLWAVRRTSSWSHYDGGGCGSTRDIVHVATSPEQCRAGSLPDAEQRRRDWVDDCGDVIRHNRFLRQQNQEPLIAQRVATFDVMMTLVSAGLALGLAGEAHIASSREPGVVARRLAGTPPMLTTYLLRSHAEPSEVLARFIERVAFIDSADSLDAEDSYPIQ
mgnify:CR=1 FL=1